MPLGDVFGLRHDGRRDGDDRRRSERAFPDRRRTNRRKRTLRGLVFGMFAISFPSHLHEPHRVTRISEGVVSTSEDFRALPATIA